MAAIARSIAEPPTVRPISDRNSRRASRVCFFASQPLNGPTGARRANSRGGLSAPAGVGYCQNSIDHTEPRLPRILHLWLVAAVLSMCGAARADTLTVAVASNFARTADAISAAFQASTGHEVRIVRGSSGKLYAQIVNGAPIDVFLSADAERPKALEVRGLIKPNSRFTYATGALVLWSRDAEFAGRDCWQALRATDEKIAIANPRLAPYGMAAQQALEREGLWDAVEDRLVYGENIAQTLQFAATGGAGAAFVARAQLYGTTLPAATCTAQVDAALHDPIAQQAVIVSRAEGRVAAAFAAFLASREARDIIASHGYRLP